MNKFWHKPVPAAYLCSAVISLISYPVLLLLFVGHPLFAGIASGAVGAIVNRVRISYLNSLHRRIKAGNEIVWDVEVNAVKVGIISDADYAAIRLAAFSDTRNYVAQFLNAFKVASVSVDKLFVAIPLALFWGGVGLAVFAPDQFTNVLATAQKVGPSGIASAAESCLQGLLLIWLVATGFNVIFGARLGFVNRFQVDVAQRLRKRCGAAADGSVTVLRWVDGVPTFNDEMAWSRRPERAKKSGS